MGVDDERVVGFFAVFAIGFFLRRRKGDQTQPAPERRWRGLGIRWSPCDAGKGCDPSLDWPIILADSSIVNWMRKI